MYFYYLNKSFTTLAPYQLMFYSLIYSYDIYFIVLMKSQPREISLFIGGDLEISRYILDFILQLYLQIGNLLKE